MAEQGWRKGPWTPEEDKLLSEYVKLNGEGRWSSVSRHSGLNRCGKSCRLRWVNYLRPGLKRGQITPQEEGIIIELHALWGNKWSTIARYLPGRTDNEIKNYWRTHFKKKDKSSQKQDKRKAQILKPEMQQHHQQQLEAGEMKMENTIDDHDKMNEAEMFHNLEDQCSSVMSQGVASWADFVVEDYYGLWGGLWNFDDHPPGICKRCGDLRMIACSGLVKEGGPISFTFIDDMYESLGGDRNVKTIRCSKCQAGGRFCCPDFSKVDSD